MREIYIKSIAGLLPIGRRGENLAARVHLAEVPESGQAVTVYVLRNGDTVAYPASEIEITDTEIIWTVTSVDTGKSGRGKVQYRFADSVTGKVIKTEIYHFVVGLAIDTEVGPAPDPYETWLDSLTELAGQVQIDARAAESAAASAQESAGAASGSAGAAAQSASQASDKATEASGSATTASQKASEAASSASSAAGSATAASGSASAASQSAGQAAASAEAASASATSAGQSKDTAQTAAQTATTKASEASASATSAASSASTATTKAGEASQSATSAASSASTASTKASEASASATSASGSASTATTKASEASASATAAQEAQVGAESAAQTAQAGADAVGLLREQIYNSYPNVEAEAGPIVSISDGADGIPVKSLVVGIEPVQAGSGDPSPDNVRPITGWTGASVTRTNGKESTDPDHVAQVYPISWQAEAGTVYGGSLDVTNGVLTVDRAMVDLGTLTWTWDSQIFMVSMRNHTPKPKYKGDLICSLYTKRVVPLTNPVDMSIYVANSQEVPILRVADSRYTDAATFKAAVTGQTLVYELASPITYQLTPTEVKTLLGTNNVWADTGDTSLAYRADTKLYIDGVYEDYQDDLADYADALAALG